MKILFFGSRGWIGKQFCKYLINDNIEYIETNIRADNEKDVEKEILEHKPTHIISFIGRTHGENYNTIDYLEQPGKLVDNIRDNLYAPIILSILCKKYNIHYTYMGTGCIFEYNNLTVLDDMFPVILDMIKNNTTGTFNMCNKGVITHNEILELYKKYVDSSFNWKNFSIEEQNKILLSKRSNIELSSKKLYELYPNIPDIKTSIDNCLQNYSKLM